ncbi:carbamoyltransferase HypF, partial [Lucifera butyrica]
MMIRLRIYMTGIVQGVGFRPFIYRLAVRHGLGGWILNNGSGVQLEVEGEAAVIDTFLAAVQDEKPALSRIQTIKIESIPPENELTFRIRESVAGSGQSPLISPDIATCPDCWREAGNPADRRYRYPFTNCTNCGPRYSIITRTPYDRPFTTMSSFPMCPECRQEYENPANRRFHAQPNACPACGPHYRLLSRTGEEISFSGTAGLFEAARRLVQEGHILAVKGLGGYHLACDARSEKAVTLLRSRKIRKDKPFAALCASLVTAKLHCEISDSEAKLLTGPVRPIVLLRKSRQYALAPSVAPGNPRIGILLPYMPVHALLLDPPDIWVMTSGNVSDEPIAYEDEDALDRLKPIADYFLIHNRPIYRRVDDSVTAVFQGEPYLLRRSRGYVPVPIALAKNLP